jgi:isocitrate dehydrogenase
LDQATGKFLDTNKSPSRKVNELDNRGSHFYLALYWAEALAAQDSDVDLQAKFTKLAVALAENENQIAEELLSLQGVAMDVGGYYKPDSAKASSAMRPSATLNRLIDELNNK